MKTEDWSLAKELFAEAIELPLDARDEFLAERCNANSEIEKQLRSMLAVYAADDDQIESNRVDLAAVLGKHEASVSEKHFGNYRIIREIGSGGMGAVYLAERDDGEFSMQVALKIIRQSIVDSEMVSRFRRERQILADLHHPNIAALHDGGVSDAGEPFLAMEYIEGKSLLEHCDTEGLGLRERLGLFRKICDAAGYAHRNLVIHRDIKPSNILVTPVGEPKLVDFGLARMVDAGSEQTTLRAFTASYASPEQIRGGLVGIGSDIYSLGVVLFELITGRKPLDVDSRSYEQILATVTNVEPPRPSSLSTADRVFADRRSADDLDTIVLTALEKEPDRRYRSAEALEEDIDRYLRGFPILAKPSTLTYRASRFLQRNKLAVGLGCIIAAVLAGALFLNVRQQVQTDRERTRAQGVKDFLEKMLMTADRTRGSGRSVEADSQMEEMLRQAGLRIESGELANQPELKAEIERVLGDVYLRQGQLDLAEKHLRSAKATGDQAFSTGSTSLLKINASITNLEWAKANYDEAEPLFDSFLPPMREAYREGSFDLDTLVSTLNNYALLRRAKGDSAKAETLYRESLKLIINDGRGLIPTELTETLLALTILDQGRFSEAEDIVRGILAKARAKADGSGMEVANALTLLGSILIERGQLGEADSSLKESHAIYVKLYSPSALPIFDNLRLQAQLHYLNGNLAAAEREIAAVIEKYRQFAGPKYISYSTALTTQGLILMRLGKTDAAEAVLREAVEHRRSNLPAGHFMTALTVGALGECLAQAGKVSEARPFLTESYESLAGSQGIENPRTELARRRLDAAR